MAEAELRRQSFLWDDSSEKTFTASIPVIVSRRVRFFFKLSAANEAVKSLSVRFKNSPIKAETIEKSNTIPPNSGEQPYRDTPKKGLF